MSESERNEAAEDVNNMGENEGGATGAGGAGTVTPQAEVSGNDPASLEVSGAGDKGRQSGDERGSESSGGVGDWDPASAGGGGGELY